MALRLHIGTFTEKVTILAFVATTDLGGGHPGLWTEHAVVFADVVGLRGTERVAAESLQSEVGHRVTIYWRSDITPQMRILWRGTTLTIQRVIDPTGRREVLELETIVSL